MKTENTTIESRKLSFRAKLTAKKNAVMAKTNIAVLTGIGMVATVGSASAEISNTTFDPIVTLIDAVIPLFSSILDLIIAVFPLVIAFAFLGGLALLINKIFHGALDFGSFKKR